VNDWTVKQVQAAKWGRYRVSQSLYLHVAMNDISKRWVFRHTKPGTRKVTEMGLGSVDVIPLAEARAKVHDLRRMVSRGLDPIEARRAARVATVTFADVASQFLEVQEHRFRNPGSAKNVRSLLFTHAKALATQPIASIDATNVDAALRPLWLERPGQARRALTAVLQVMRYARAKGLCNAPVAEWREHMRELMPRVNGTHRHFAALDYAEVPEFVRQLRIEQQRSEALSPFVIEFILLTAVRENEAVGMRFSEIDWQERVWTVPAERMKAGRVHRVPLCDRAMALLHKQRGSNAFGLEPDPAGYYVWPGRNGVGPVTGKSVYKYLTQTMGVKATVHGFRSSFRTWSGNETNFDRVTCELALSHAAGSQVELAYRRGDELAKRRQLMEAWAEYCGG
jgi:integrase